MAGNQILEAALVGFGTTKLSGGAGLADTTLLAALGLTAFPDGCKGVDIYVAGATTGAVYYENDGSAADANAMPLDLGVTLRIRNALALMNVLHLFATGVYDLRVALWG